MASNNGSGSGGRGRPGAGGDRSQGGSGRPRAAGSGRARPDGSSRAGGGERRGTGSARGGERGRPEQGRGRPEQGRGRPAPREREERDVEQQRYDGPPIPEHITGKELDRDIIGQLRSLPEKLALRVARHLVAAGQALESEPAVAYQHTLAARARAGRLAVVREAVGEAAYAAGEYAEALQELRTARRMNGSPEYLAVMADCERALGRPDRALALVRSAPREKLSSDQRAELTIVEAGARRDRGENEAALRTLELAPLDSRARAPWVARLRYTYADTLADVGRLDDALEWFHRTDAVDGEGLTDASQRAEEIERQLGDR